jgi:protein-S-isoprenylcysteine O-methyltransferase Ste14
VSDREFRLLVLIHFASVLPFTLYYRIRSVTSERLDRWQEGAWILFGLRLGGLPLFLGVMAWMIEPDWMAWAALPLPVWLRWLGLATAVASGLLLVWTFRHLGRNLTDTVVTRKDHTLVTSGPYRYVRHPFYLSFALGVLGGSLVTANWFILLGGSVPLAFLAARTRIEEQKLIDRFGGAYRSYMERVGRFWPRWH